MDPLTVAVTTILGKYAIDKGASLIKEAGQAAAGIAGKLVQKVIDRLKADPTEAKNADRFEKDPAKHQELIGEAIDEKIKSDPNLKAELQSLVDEFRKSAGNTFSTQFFGDYNLNVGVVEQGGTINYTAGNVMGNKTITNRSGGTDINASQVDIGGDVVGRDKKSDE